VAALERVDVARTYEARPARFEPATPERHAVRGMAVAAYGEPLHEHDLPEPQLAPGHALLEVLTCGVCFSDVKTSRGKMPFSDRLALPHVPGHEICARVVASDGDALAPGTVVVVYHLWPCRRCGRCRAGQDQLCEAPRGWTGFMSPGVFQERMVVPIDRLTVVPDAIHPVHAAPLTCAIGTSYRAVMTRGGVTGGSRVAVIGLGGVGIHALQMARAAGAVAVGLDTSERTLATAERLGLRALDAGDPASERAILDEAPGGVDVVIDTVGREPTIAQAYRIVRPGGRIVAVGYGVGSDFVIESPRFVLTEIELVGSRYVSLDELERAIRLVAAGDVVPVIDRVLPLERANEAFEALEAGTVSGRVVLDVAGVGEPPGFVPAGQG
jgi:D-arabinose 1-dehydrogenase-like Zn-dependent alcohol dehydrogenase